MKRKKKLTSYQRLQARLVQHDKHSAQCMRYLENKCIDMARQLGEAGLVYVEKLSGMGVKGDDPLTAYDTGQADLFWRMARANEVALRGRQL